MRAAATWAQKERKGRGGRGMQEQQLGKRKKAEKNEVTVSDAVVTSALNSRGSDRGWRA